MLLGSLSSYAAHTSMLFRFLPLAGIGQRLAVCIHLAYIGLQRRDGGSIGLLLEQRLSFLVESLGRSTLLACLC